MIRQRLLNQQLLSPLYSTPAEVVAHMGAMQAQEYRLMRWAVAMRTQHPSAQAFADDYNSGRIVRLHLMRGTWQLISGADYWWMLDLFSERAKRVINGWMKSSKITIQPQEYDRIRTILIDTAQRQPSITKEDIVQSLAAHDIVMDDHRLSYHIRMAELDGVLCSGQLHPMKATYCLAVPKMGRASTYNREESAHILARRYFQSHSPATLDDFVWWTGLTKAECERAIASLGGEMSCLRHCGVEFYTLDSCPTASRQRSHPILLPSYDEYLIGYKSRHIVLDSQFSHLAHTGNGIFFPVVLCRGIVSGNWRPFEQQLSVQMFQGGEVPTALAQQWALYLQYQSN